MKLLSHSGIPCIRHTRTHARTHTHTHTHTHVHTSGGIEVTFIGANLDVVQRPMLVVNDTDYVPVVNVSQSTCIVVSQGKLMCSTFQGADVHIRVAACIKHTHVGQNREICLKRPVAHVCLPQDTIKLWHIQSNLNNLHIE